MHTAVQKLEAALCIQVLVVGHGFKALPEDDVSAEAREKGPPTPAAPEVGVDPIDVPRCRQLSKSRKTSDSELHSTITGS